MHVLMVYIHVKPEFIEAFRAASTANASSSLKEAGVVRFDVLQQKDDQERFMLVEVYRQPEDHARHRETAHFNTWKDAVEPMMAEPRTRTLLSNVFPDDENWG